MRKSLGSRLAWACLTCLSCVGQNTKSLVTSNGLSNLRLLLVIVILFILKFPMILQNHCKCGKANLTVEK